MALVLGIDIETTGLDPDKDHIIEIGWVFWDTKHKCPIEMASRFIRGDGLIPEGIQHLTGISDSLRQQGTSLGNIVPELKWWAGKVDYLVAHNAEFERSFLDQRMRVMDICEKWIDTQTDLPYLPGKGKGSLSEIAMAHGVFNPMPHRALPDALCMMQIFAKYDFSEIERYANAETKTLLISFPYDASGERNQKVKALGYRWEPLSKRWIKKLKDFQVEDAQEQAKEVGFTAHFVDLESAVPF